MLCIFFWLFHVCRYRRDYKGSKKKKLGSDESPYRHEALFILPVNKDKFLSPADKQSTLLCLAAWVHHYSDVFIVE